MTVLEFLSLLADMISPAAALDMLFQFSLHAAALLAVACVATLCFSLKRPTVLLGGLALCLFAIPVSATRIGSPELGRPVDLTVVSFNVQAYSHSHEKAFPALLLGDPDVLLLQEVKGDRWSDRIGALELRGYHTARDPDANLAIVSRFPLRAIESPLEFGVFADIDMGSETITIGSVHLPKPTDSEAYRVQRQAIADLAWFSQGRAMLLGGDFNMTPWSPTLLRAFPRTEWSRLPAHGMTVATWPTAIPWLGAPIDHIHTNAGRILSFRRLSDLGSNHFPVSATIALHR